MQTSAIVYMTVNILLGSNSISVVDETSILINDPFTCVEETAEWVDQHQDTLQQMFAAEGKSVTITIDYADTCERIP